MRQPKGFNHLLESANLNLIIGHRRIALIGAIAAVALTIIFYPLLVYTPIDTSKVNISLGKVQLASGSAGQQQLVLTVTFNVTNRNHMTLTTSIIDYDLSANGVRLGTHSLSYEDVPLNGRPALFPDTTVPLVDSAFTITYTDQNAAIFNKILNDNSQIKWSVTGTATLETGTTQQTKNFSSEV